MIERLKDVTVSGRKLAAELGISTDRVCRKRKELGVNYDEWKRKNPKPRALRVYTPRPKKLIVNEKGNKELPIRIVRLEVTPMRKSKFESDNDEKQKAVKAKESFAEIQERQRLDGYTWKTRICPRGIKQTVWTNK